MTEIGVKLRPPQSKLADVEMVLLAAHLRCLRPCCVSASADGAGAVVVPSAWSGLDRLSVTEV